MGVSYHEKARNMSSTVFRATLTSRDHNSKRTWGRNAISESNDRIVEEVAARSKQMHLGSRKVLTNVGFVERELASINKHIAELDNNEDLLKKDPELYQSIKTSLLSKQGVLQKRLVNVRAKQHSDDARARRREAAMKAKAEADMEIKTRAGSQSPKAGGALYSHISPVPM
jgi:hypothetical protein